MTNQRGNSGPKDTRPKGRWPALRLLAAAMSLVVLACSLALMAPAPAFSQEKPQRRTLLQMLFGKPSRSITTIEEKPVKPRRKVNRNKVKKATTDVAGATAPAVKLPTAKKVLVVGDFLAGGLGDGLQVAFEPSAGTVIETRANGSSGVVRDDYYNWPVELPKLIDEVQPSVIVVAMGANDRQAFRSSGIKDKFRSEKWLEEYGRRVAALAAIGRDRKLPLLWVGMPAFQSSTMTADMVALNGVFRTEAEKAGGQFVDIWDGFVDEAGKFILTGSDINGQQVRLRAADGINLTKAGKRKIAFYVEKEIRRLLGDEATTGSDVLGSAKLSDIIVVPAVNQNIVKTPPISLADPELDGGSVLLGGSMLKTLNGQSPRDILVEKGEVAEAPAGRVDDFRLAKPSTILNNPVIRN